MKKLILAVFLAFGLVPAAFAQYGTCNPRTFPDGTVRWICPPGVSIGGGTYAVPQPMYNPYYGVGPQQYGNSGGGLSTPTIVGGILGATVGSLAHHHKPQAIIGGTILGGILGSLFSSNSGQRVVAQQPTTQMQPAIPQQMIVSGPSVPAEQWVGSGVGGGVNQVTVRTVMQVATDCGVTGYPELQNLKGLTEAQCAAVAKLAKANTSTTSVPAAPPTEKDTNPPVASAPQVPRDNKIRACKLQKAPDTPVLAVSVPDPNNPNWKLEPSKPGETCQEWKDRIEPSLG